VNWQEDEQETHGGKLMPYNDNNNSNNNNNNNNDNNNNAFQLMMS